MNEFLSDPFVQMVLAICTFIGGIVAVMQVFTWYEEETVVGDVDSHIDYLRDGRRLPLWIARERHIFKKAIHTWNYKVFSVLYSGRASPGNFGSLGFPVVTHNM